MKWISEDLAIAIHGAQLEEHGGPSGVRDLGLLDSALSRPKNITAYEEDNVSDLPRLAAAYGYGILRNHPFIDGNKRTALVVMETFLYLNGLELKADDSACVMTITAVAADTLNETGLAAWIRANCEPVKTADSF